MAQQLRALVALPEDLGSIPSNHMPVASVSGDLMAFSTLCEDCVHKIPKHVHTYMHAHPYT